MSQDQGHKMVYINFYANFKNILLSIGTLVCPCVPCVAQLSGTGLILWQIVITLLLLLVVTASNHLRAEYLSLVLLSFLYQYILKLSMPICMANSMFHLFKKGYCILCQCAVTV